MKKRRLDSSEVEVSVVVFGAWAAGGWMWGGNERAKSIEAIRASIELGVTSIDTAPIYGQGLSEEIVGEAILDIPRADLQILTKCGLRWDVEAGEFFFESEGNDGHPVRTYRYAARDSVIAECEASLLRLGTDYLDLLQLHWPDPTTPIDETMEALAKLADQGKIRAAGVSNYSVEQMRVAEQTVSLASNQMPYSMVNRGIEADLVPYCVERGRAILAYSPLQRGLLTGKYRPGHAFAAGDHRARYEFFTDENVRRVDAFLDSIRPLADARGITLAQLVIAWTIAQPGITAALVGARDAEQARANAQGGEIELTPAELDEIARRLAGLRLDVE
ncbi:MAG: aldo/keto reductase [Terrimicrobiaceae bacterium]|nr:aldo/keto reductase [Terrimicrobiaceae bacterium]